MIAQDYCYGLLMCCFYFIIQVLFSLFFFYFYVICSMQEFTSLVGNDETLNCTKFLNRIIDSCKRNSCCSIDSNGSIFPSLFFLLFVTKMIMKH